MDQVTPQRGVRLAKILLGAVLASILALAGAAAGWLRYAGETFRSCPTSSAEVSLSNLAQTLGASAVLGLPLVFLAATVISVRGIAGGTPRVWTVVTLGGIVLAIGIAALLVPHTQMC